MEHSIATLLNKNRVDSIFNTHVSMIEPFGKFQLNRESMSDFWNIYSKSLETDEDPIYGIAENPKDSLPILVDVDLKLKVEKNNIMDEKLYTTEQLRTVVEIYQSVIRSVVNKCTDETLICVVLEKDSYYQEKGALMWLKNGFHLHFPYCFLNKTEQEVHLIPRIKDKMTELRVFENLGFENSGDVIDKGYLQAPWLLYGSRKSKTAKAYKVSKIYDSNVEEISLKKAFMRYQLYDMNENLIKVNKNVNFYLPQILSIVPNGREVYEIKKGLISPLKEKLKKVQKVDEVKTDYEIKTVAENLSVARELIPMLSEHRAKDYNEWLHIGWTLFNISDGDLEGLELWNDFSAKDAEKYDEDHCTQVWSKMIKKPVPTIATLRYYAKIDSPDNYKKYKDEARLKIINVCLDGSTHNDIARILYEEFNDEFKCGSIDNKLWFRFVSHKWEKTESGVDLRNRISNNIVGMFEDTKASIYALLQDKHLDKTQESALKDRAENVGKMINKLKDANYKASVMKESMDIFYDKHFAQKLDTDKWLIAFQNGVYDLKLNVFRAGRPEDYLSKCLPFNYVEFSEEDDEVVKVRDFLGKVFPDSELRKYFLDTSSDVFVGGNARKEVLFWTGVGDNGKSVTQTFFEKMLGPLAVKMNTALLTQKKPAAGAANADLARTGGGVRWVVVEEPNKDEEINTGVLKHFTGNDSFYARDLFEKGKDGREIEPMFKLSIICNKLPHLKHADKATWNRVKVLPFESKFLKPTSEEKVPDSIEEQFLLKKFPADLTLTDQIPTLIPAFCWILLDHRTRIVNRFEPAKVLQATIEYRRQNDNYKKFIDECLVADKDSTISLRTIYEMFKSWWREACPNSSIPNKNDIEEYFTLLWGDYDNDRRKEWVGWKIFVLEEAIENGDAIVL